MKTTAFRFIKLLARSRWLRAAVLLAWPLLLAENASAQTTFWVADGVGNWNVPANWSAGVPTSANEAQINNGGTARLFDPGARARLLNLGVNPGNSGTLEVLGGSASIDEAIVGLGGVGTIKIANSGSVHILTGGTIIGANTGSSGIVTVDGPDSFWEDEGYFQVGRGGTGTLNITGGGGVSSFNGAISLAVDFNGAATVAGAGSTWRIIDEFYVGHTGEGALSITGGATVSNRHGFIGHVDNSIGTAAVAGANSKWTNFGDLNVGLFGSGELNITGGGKVLADNGYIASGAGSSGAVTIDGAGSAWTNTNELAVGSSGDGTLNITGGGVVASTIGYIGRYAGSTGTVLIDGPGSRWNASGVFTMGNSIGLFGVPTATLEVRNGGVLSAVGVGGMTIAQYGVVQGDGTIVGHVQNFGGFIAPSSPGTSLGTLHITGSYTNSGGAKLHVELASNSSFDKLAVTGLMTLPFGSIVGGGTLEVSLAGGYVPQGSRSFDILDWGSLSGAFDSVVLPTLGGTLVWDTSQLYTTGVLSVTGPAATPLAADFDENGVVNGADLARRKAGFRTGATHLQGNADGDADVDGADFLTWQRQLGSVATVTVSAPIPEPGTLLLLVSGVVALFFRRRS